MIDQQLKDAYKSGKLVLFIGSGLSWKLGLPTWDELVIKTIDLIRESVDDKRLQVLVDGINNQALTPLEVLDKLDSFKYRTYCYKAITEYLKINQEYSNWEMHKKLAAFCPKIITT